MEISELYEIFKQHPVVTTDSRDCPVGSLFFALKGASFNGNKFAAAALEKGCAYAVVDEAEYVVEGDARFILVDNCLHTLQQLARYHRRALGTPIIGITGTNGKTTTKELTAAVLLQKYNVLYTEGNFNNDIGVPKTLLRLNSTHDIAVVEMGASHPGDIKTLVEIVEPDYALITNVGRAHLQGFGSFEGVIRTKGELYDFVRSAAAGENDAYAIREVERPRCVFIDNDNPHLNGIATGLNLVRYGINAADNLYVTAADVKSEPMLSFTWEAEGKAAHHVESQLIGAYNITNMLAAIAIGTYFGVEAERIDATQCRICKEYCVQLLQQRALHEHRIRGCTGGRILSYRYTRRHQQNDDGDSGQQKSSVHRLRTHQVRRQAIHHAHIRPAQDVDRKRATA